MGDFGDLSARFPHAPTVGATAVEAGRSIVVTGDPDDIARLAAPYPTVSVVVLA